MRRRTGRDRERGQSAVEYMLVVSVLVVALVAAGVPFQTKMRSAVRTWGNYFNTYFAESPEPR